MYFAAVYSDTDKESNNISGEGWLLVLVMSVFLRKIKCLWSSNIYIMLQWTGVDSFH
jgi:hypothetical protein